MQLRNLRPAILVATLAVACAGCGQDISTVPAKGVVRFPDGSPLPGGVLECRSTNLSEPQLATGEFGADGVFELRTGGIQGAVPGEYEVVVSPILPDDMTGIPKAQQRHAMNPIDRKYWDYSTSPLRITVTEDPAQNNITLEVTRPK